MPPHTTLHYTMPPNTTNSKSTATTANNGTTQMNTNNKSVSTPTKTTRQRRATSGSSYIFAPSWLTNLNNKSGPSTTVLNSAYVSTEEKSVKEDVKGVVSLKKDGLGSNRQAKEGLGKDGSSSLSRPLVNGVSPLSPNRSRSRDFTSPRLSGFDEIENHESPVNKIHGRSRSVSQVNQPVSSTSSSFDKNFPTLAKKKQMNLSVDLPTKNVENIWANSDTKSKLLSPTSTTPNAEEHTKFNIPNIDVEPELERRMSLVPKVEVGKLDGKRVKHSMKRKTSRSLSVDSVARGPNGSSVFGFGVGIGISNNRSLGQSQNAKNYLRDTTSSKPTSTQPQRQRAASISSSNGIKKASSTTSRVGSFGHSTISGRKSSIGGNSKNLWSNTAMGKMGYFKIFPEEEEEEEDDYEGHLNGRKEDICDHIEEEEEEDEESSEDISNEKDKDDIINSSKNVHNFNNNNNNNSPPPSVESEEKFLLQLGWQKPYNKDADSKEWAITDEEKRFFVKLIRALNGISISESDMSNDLSRNEIDRAKKRWAALVKNVNINGGNKIFNMGYQSNVTNQRHI